MVVTMCGSYNVRIQRGDGRRGPESPEKSQKYSVS